MLSPRMGRPRVDNPKSNDLKVRIDDNTHANLLTYCKNHNMTLAEAVRKGIKLLLEEK